MAERATWKGSLKFGELVAGVALYPAVSTRDRVSLHMVSRRTGHRLVRRLVDPETGAEVERGEQVKGYEVAPGDYVVLEPEEVAEAVPKADKLITVDSFVACAEVDDLHFDRSYYLRPADEASRPGFAVVRDGLRQRQAAALANAVLFRRPRTLLLRPRGNGLVATLLLDDEAVRSAAEAFAAVPEVEIDAEMLDLARHIIQGKAGAFRPEAVDDRYDAALAELVRAKIEGRKIRPPKAPAARVVDLKEALRRSAALADKPAAARKPARARKAG
jgi:DNA end-binding protein Ku